LQEIAGFRFLVFFFLGSPSSFVANLFLASAVLKHQILEYNRAFLALRTLKSFLFLLTDLPDRKSLRPFSIFTPYLSGPLSSPPLLAVVLPGDFFFFARVFPTYYQLPPFFPFRIVLAPSITCFFRPPLGSFRSSLTLEEPRSAGPLATANLLSDLLSILEVFHRFFLVE